MRANLELIVLSVDDLLGFKASHREKTPYRCASRALDRRLVSKRFLDCVNTT